MQMVREWTLDERAADFYEKHFVPAIFADWARVLVAESGVRAEDRVLDVGCGTGIVARTVAETFDNDEFITGIDINWNMIRTAQKKNPIINWQEGDAARMPFTDESFDAVLSQAALMFLPDRLAALKEMRRVLRHNGKLAVLVWGMSTGYDLTADILEEIAGKQAADTFRAPFSMKDLCELKELLENAGFADIRLKTHHGAARFPSLESFFQTEIDGWVLAGQVDVQKFFEAGKTDLKHYTDPEGNVTIPMEAHITTAVKIKD